MADVAPNGFAARLVVREPLKDDHQAYLDSSQSWKLTLVQSTLGENGLVVTYDAGVSGVEWLLKECDIAVEVNTGSSGVWYEPDNCRFINLGSDRELTARIGVPVTAKLQSYAWLLSKTVVEPDHGQKIDKKDLRTFRNTTAGGVMAELVNEARARGQLLWLRTPFGTAEDSAGRSWGDDIVNVEFKVGSTLLEVLNQLIADGACEARMNGRELQLYKTWAQFPYSTNATILRTGEDLLSFDEQIDRSNRATHALLLGDNGQYMRHATSPSLTSTKWGPWETTINLSGVKKPQLLAQGRKKLSTMAAILVSNKAEVVFRVDGPRPFANYRHGDYITVNPANGPGRRLRIMEMEIGWSEKRFSGALTFGDRRLAPVTRVANAVKTLAPTGFTTAGAGRPAIMANPRPARHDVFALGAEANGFDPDDVAVAEIIPDMQPGDSFFVPPGRAVTLNDAVTFNDRTIVEGGGTIIQRTPGRAGVKIGPGAHGSIVRDVILNGTGYATLATNSNAIDLRGTSNAQRLRDIVIERVKINNWQQYGIYNDLLENLRVTDCEMNGIHYAGLGSLSLRGGKVIGNRVKTIQGLASNNNGYGMYFSRLSSFSELDRPVSSDVMVAFNTVDGVPTWEGLDTHAGVNISFVCNEVFNCRVGIAVVSGVNQAGVAAFGAKNVKVIGNTADAQVADGSRGPGIIVQGAGTVVGEFIDPATGIVAQNTVRNHGLQEFNINGGIQCYWTMGLRVALNYLYQCSPGSITMFHTNRGYYIGGNTMEAVWSTSHANPSHIYIPSNYNTGELGSGNRTIGTSKGAAFNNVYGFFSSPVNATNVVRESAYQDFRQIVTAEWRDQSQTSEGGSHATKWAVRNRAPIVAPTLPANPTTAQIRQVLLDQGLAV